METGAVMDLLPPCNGYKCVHKPVLPIRLYFVGLLWPGGVVGPIHEGSVFEGFCFEKYIFGGVIFWTLYFFIVLVFLFFLSCFPEQCFPLKDYFWLLL